MKNISVSYQILLITVTTALFSTSCSTESPTNNEEPRSNYTNRDLTLTATLSGDTHMEFMWIDGGSFLMGSPLEEQGRSADEVQHQVTLSSGFYLGKYEVTQEQWASVMDTKPWLDASRSQLDDIIFSEMDVISQPNHPVVYVSWDDVQAFIDRLNQTVGKEIYRLPTEAEWEYAARAGTTTRWSFGESERLLGEYAWYAGNRWNVGKKHAQPVGMKRANPWGLHDMYGNVWEWCQDKYGEYDPSEAIDPQGPTEGLHRVMRGGGFSYDAQSSSSAHRGSDRELLSFGFRSSFHGGLGFRLLRVE